MAAVEVQFEVKDGRFISSPIEVTSPNLCVQIDFEKTGDVMLLKSATGNSYVAHSFLGNYGTRDYSIVSNITGAVVGMFLRLQFMGDAKPSKIYVIQ